GIRSSFTNDIIKSSEDFVSAILVEGIAKRRDVVLSFATGLSNSQHQANSEVYRAIFDKLNTRQNQFDILSTVIMSEPENTHFAIHFGLVFFPQYANDLDATESKLRDKWIIMMNGDVEPDVQKPPA